MLRERTEIKVVGKKNALRQPACASVAILPQIFKDVGHLETLAKRGR